MAQISKEAAINIFKDHIIKSTEIYQITDTLPDNIPFYHSNMGCWFIICRAASNFLSILGPRRLIAISKKDGKVVYDGTTNEE
jgi:hypothetical protein